ncbi:MAG: hypothetical protein Q8Q09_18675 [Deltaproteobacteria bacterium]|nr:hypothetical protein [Deltaproteobacteria bacterium]
MVGDNEQVFANDEVDEQLRKLFDSQEGKKQGITADDMGIWGLLWVQQDEFATQEPGETMGKRVKADLQSAVGRQVGQVIGGQDGQRLMDAIDTEFFRFFTQKRDVPTGDYAEGQQKVESLRKTVSENRDALKAAEELSRKVQELERTFENLNERQGELDREVVHAQTALDEAVKTEQSLAQHRVYVDEAAANLQLQQARREQREKRRTANAEAEVLLEQLRKSAAELQAQATHVRGGFLDSKRAHEEAMRAEQAIRQQVQALSQRLERQQLELDSQRKARDLDEARRCEQDALRVQSELEGLPTEAHLRELEAMHRSSTELRASLERTSTRVSTQVGNDRAETVHLSRAMEIVLGHSLGTMTMDPARSGFRAKRNGWREKRSLLELALARAQVYTVGELRSRYASAQRDAEAKAQFEAALANFAPKGLDALRDEHGKADRELRACIEFRDIAREIEARLELAEAELLAIAIEPHDQRNVRKLSAQIDAQRAAGAMTVQVRVRALKDAQVRLGTHGVSQFLAAGNELRDEALEPWVLTVNDQIEVQIDPGLLTTHAMDLRRLQSELHTTLERLGTDSVDAFEARVELQLRREAERDSAQQQLSKAAPKGLGMLEERVEKSRKLAQQLRRSLDSANVLVAAQPVPSSDPGVEPEVLATIEALSRDTLSLELETRALSPRIRAVEGAIASKITAPYELVEDTEFDFEGVVVRMIPGESGADVECVAIESKLRAKLERLGVESVEQARAAHLTYVASSTRQRELYSHLSRVAPNGVAVCEAELHALSERLARLPNTNEVVETSATLLLARATAERELEDACARTVVASEVMMRRSEEARAMDQRATEAQVTFEERLQVLRSQTQALDEERALASDSELEEHFALATQRLAQATAAQSVVASKLEIDDPARRRAALAQATQQLAAHADERNRTRDALSRHSGELDEVARQGRFDQLQENERLLEDAESDLAQLAETAQSVRLLKRIAAKEYLDAADSLLLPVRQAAASLLPMLWRESALQLESGGWKVKSLIRNGVAEEFGELSGGAREQLAVIVRIALAQVLARDRSAMPLILDDILGWTDDERLRRMLQVLEKASQQMQVILLTCHPRRFEKFVGARQFAMSAP